MNRVCRLHPVALAILLVGWAPARAQDTAQPAGGYVDQVIEGLEPEVLDDAQTYDYDKTGWSRFLKLETRLGTQPFDDQRSARLGYSAYGVLETPNHGTLSLDGNYAPEDGEGTLDRKSVV